MTPTEIVPRLLLVGPFPPTRGGVTTFMKNLMASHLAGAVSFMPFTTSRPPKKNVTRNWGYAAVFRGGLARVLAGILVTLWHLALFPFAVIFRRIDLVQIQASDYQVFWEAALYALMAKALRRPVLMRIGGAFDIFHGTSPDAVKKLIAAALRIPDCLIVQSDVARRYVEGVARPRRILILPNWTGVAIAPSPTPSAVSLPRFLFIAGSEAIRKGVDEVLAAAQQLKAQGVAVRIHVVAAPPGVVKQISALKLDDILTCEGSITQEQMLERMREADGFLLPSHGEGFPNSLVEAMAAGLPSVVTPVGSVPEIVAEGGAILVPAGDAGALAQAIRKLAGDPALRVRLGCHAQDIIRMRYVPAVVLAPLAAEYRRLTTAAA